LLEDAREFLASEKWYAQRGIPYRRGYLLHGVPGGGKSSLVMAVAHELQLPIYMLQLSSKEMGDDTLNKLLQFGMHDPPSILLLEDVDLLHSAVLQRRGTEDKADKLQEAVEQLQDKQDANREGGKSQGASKLSLSGLLNALDGPAATTGRLLFMTTNARERLDPALLRSGRIDYEVEFKEVETEQVERLFMGFYTEPSNCEDNNRCGEPHAVVKAKVLEEGDGTAGCAPEKVCASEKVGSNETHRLAAQFAQQVVSSGLKLTSADIQRHLMGHKTSPEHALAKLPSLFRTFAPQQQQPQQQQQEPPAAPEQSAEAQSTVGSNSSASCPSPSARPSCEETSGHASANSNAGETVTTAEHRRKPSPERTERGEEDRDEEPPCNGTSACRETDEKAPAEALETIVVAASAEQPASCGGA